MDVKLMVVAIRSRLTLFIDKLSKVVSNVKTQTDALVCYLTWKNIAESRDVI